MTSATNQTQLFCFLRLLRSRRTIDPKQCNPRTLQKPKTRGGSFPKVFLGGLPSNITETDLRMFFGRYGKVMEVVIMYDQEKKKSRGFGFLSFEDDASVDRVTTEHYITLNGKQVEIKKAEPRDGSANHKMNQDPSQSAGSHWGPPGPVGMMQGPDERASHEHDGIDGESEHDGRIPGMGSFGGSAAKLRLQPESRLQSELGPSTTTTTRSTAASVGKLQRHATDTAIWFIW
jgi:RNA recognition motif-containing protein